MLKNYILVAFRNVKRNKLFAFLNVMGLSLGMASFFMIYLFVQNELSYDAFYDKSEDIYRVIEEVTDDTGGQLNGGLTGALAPEASANIPQITAYARVENYPKTIGIPNSLNDTLTQVNSIGTDPGFLDVFAIDLLIGDKASALDDPGSLLIAKSKAETFFGSVENAIGQEITLRNQKLNVKGVYDDFPENTSLKAHIIGNIKDMNPWRGDDWIDWKLSYFDQTYFRLSPGGNIVQIEEALNKVVKANFDDPSKSYSLQPISDVHFSLGVSDAVNGKTDKQYIYIFSAVALFILCCAVFNYVSLTLSHALQRMKELGVRRVVGAKVEHVYLQMIIESWLFVLLSFVLSVVFVEITLPELEALLSRELQYDLISNPNMVLAMLGFSLLIGLIASLYPAYLNVNQQTVQSLKGGTAKWSSQRIINAITVFQLVVFMVLISVAFIAKKQMYFMQNENLGFDQENQLVIQMFSAAAAKNKDAFINALEKNPNVINTSFTTSVPTRVMGSTRFLGYDFNFFNFDVDQSYLETLDLQLLEGRNFEPEDMSNDEIILINETAAKMMNLKGDVVGQVLDAGSKKFRIIGVLSDFHFLSKKQEIGATMFKPIQSKQGVLIVKLRQGDVLSTMERIKSQYESLIDEDMNSFFLEDQIESQYKQEKTMMTVINTFTVLAALVALLGLFGITSYATKRRLKEMGIRKVLGAGFFNIQSSLNTANVFKLLIAGILSVPLIYLWMDDWLNSFAYRIEFPFILVGGALLIAAIIALTTAFFHSIKAYLINPVDILKDE